MDPREHGEPALVDHEIDDLAAALAAQLDHDHDASGLSASDQEQDLGDTLQALLRHTKHHTP